MGQMGWNVNLISVRLLWNEHNSNTQYGYTFLNNRWLKWQILTLFLSSWRVSAAEHLGASRAVSSWFAASLPTMVTAICKAPVAQPSASELQRKRRHVFHETITAVADTNVTSQWGAGRECQDPKTGTDGVIRPMTLTSFSRTFLHPWFSCLLVPVISAILLLVQESWFCRSRQSYVVIKSCWSYVLQYQIDWCLQGKILDDFQNYKLEIFFYTPIQLNSITSGAPSFTHWNGICGIRCQFTSNLLLCHLIQFM